MTLKSFLEKLEIWRINKDDRHNFEEQIQVLSKSFDLWGMTGTSGFSENQCDRIKKSPVLRSEFLLGMRALLRMERPYYFPTQMEIPLKLNEGKETVLSAARVNILSRLGFYPSYVIEEAEGGGAPSRIWKNSADFEILGEEYLEKVRDSLEQHIDDIQATSMNQTWINPGIEEISPDPDAIFYFDPFDLSHIPTSIGTIVPHGYNDKTTLKPDLMSDVRIPSKSKRTAEHPKGISTHRSKIIIRWLSENRPQKSSKLTMIFDFDPALLEDEYDRRLSVAITEIHGGTIGLSSLGHFLLTKDEVLAPSENWNTVFQFSVTGVTEKFIPISNRTTREDFAEALYSKCPSRNDKLPTFVTAGDIRCGEFDKCLFVAVTKGLKYTKTPPKEELKFHWAILQRERLLFLGRALRPTRNQEINEKTFTAISKAQKEYGKKGAHVLVYDELVPYVETMGAGDSSYEDSDQFLDEETLITQRKLATQRSLYSRENRRRNKSPSWKNPYLKIRS